MSNAFDPYLNWLAIRDPQRPPNHYRLLGLELFEQDGNVIALAADRQMAQVRHFQAGQHAEHAERILNELAAARLCLLKPERRTQYDLHLRSKLTPAAVKPALQTTPRIPQPIPMSDARALHALQPSSSASVSQRTAINAGRSKKYFPLGMWLTLAGVLLLCGILITALVIRHSGESGDMVAQQPESVPKPMEKNLSNTPVAKTNNSVTSPRNNVSVLTSTGKNLIENTVKTIEAQPQPKPNKNSTATAPGTPLPSPIKPDEAPQKTDENPRELPIIGETPSTNEPEVALAENPENAKPTESPMTEAARDPRQPIPVKNEFDTKQKEVHDLFKEEYAARDPQAKMAFAAQLLKTARETTTDHTLRFVLLTEARDMAANSGNIDVVYTSSKQLAEEYVVDSFGDLVTATTKLQAVTGRPADYYRSLLMKILEVVESLQKNDDYESALRMSNIGIGLAKKLNDQTFFQQYTTLNKELLQAKILFAKVKSARDKLKTDPNDPVANGVWGLYLCFQKGDITAGLPLLARSDDAALSTAAKKTIAGAKNADSKLALADDWWELSEKEKDIVRAGMRELAGSLYQEVLPSFKGIALTKIEKRLKELQGNPSGVGGKDSGLRRQLTSTRWTLTWMNPVAKEVISFLPNGTCKDHYLFVAWELQNGDVILKTAPDDKQVKVGRIRLVKGQFLVDYSINGKSANTAIATPNLNGM